MLLKEIYDYIDEIAPFSLQEEWDNSGLQVGSFNQAVHRVLVALDATKETVLEAKEKQCDLVITHHPFLFHAQKQFVNENPAFLAAKYGISLISAHTSFDVATGGVQDVLAKQIGLQNVRVADDGLLRLGTVQKQTAKEFAKIVKEQLHATVGVSLGEKPIQTVALCSGAGADLWEEALLCGADAFLTGEMKHHEVLDANAKGLSTIVAGHFETEIFAMQVLQNRLQEKFKSLSFCFSDASSPIQYI